MVDEYLWIVVLGGFISFVVAYGLGANDVANAFATSVGSKALTLRQAIFAAAIFEFVGSVALGAEVTKTISGGIASPNTFKNDPDVFMYGMLCAAAAAGVWLLVATYFSLPVSSTHSIIGGVVGFALVYKGNDAIIWSEKIDDFPYYKGLGVVIVSWVIAPASCAIIAATMFFIVRATVLRHQNSVTRAIYSLPLLVMLAFFINFYFILYKGVKAVHRFNSLDSAWAAAIAAGIGGVLTGCLVPTLLKKHEAGQLKNMHLEGPELTMDSGLEGAENGTGGDAAAVKDKDVKAVGEGSAAGGSWMERAKKAALYSVDYDIHQAVVTDDHVRELHANAEQFDGQAEGLYSYAQIFTACCVSFAHGANDVANAAGPFAAIYGVYRSGKVAKEADAPRWILALGGVGIVIGLATYGYNVMAALGVHTIKITPARGFLIELTTALVVSVGSGLGLPLSSTHCQVGGTWGVGLTEGHRGGVNFPLAVKFAAGWVGTLLTAGLLSAGLFAQGVYSPTLQPKITPPKAKTG